MKYILSKKIHENVKQAIKILNDKGVDANHPDYLTIKNRFSPNLWGLMCKFRFEQGNSMNDLDRILTFVRDKNNLSKLTSNFKNILQYNNLEELEDDIQKVELDKKSNKYYAELTPTLKEQFRESTDDIKKEITQLFIQLDDLSNKKVFISSIARIYTIDILIRDLTDFIEKSTDDSDFSEKFKNIGSVKDSEIVYSDATTGIIVSRILSYQASTELGTSRWCIVYSYSHWASRMAKDKPDDQYFIWNTELAPTNDLYLVGLTTDFEDKIKEIQDSSNSSLLYDRPKFIKNLIDLDVFKNEDKAERIRIAKIEKDKKEQYEKEQERLERIRKRREKNERRDDDVWSDNDEVKALHKFLELGRAYDDNRESLITKIEELESKIEAIDEQLNNSGDLTYDEIDKLEEDKIKIESDIDNIKEALGDDIYELEPLGTHYGLNVYSSGSLEYAIGTDDEATKADREYIEGLVEENVTYITTWKDFLDVDTLVDDYLGNDLDYYIEQVNDSPSDYDLSFEITKTGKELLKSYIKKLSVEDEDNDELIDLLDRCSEDDEYPSVAEDLRTYITDNELDFDEYKIDEYELDLLCESDEDGKYYELDSDKVEEKTQELLDERISDYKKDINYFIDDMGISDEILKKYVDTDKLIDDIAGDERGNSLASYDGYENYEDYNEERYYIYRIN